MRCVATVAVVLLAVGAHVTGADLAGAASRRVVIYGDSLTVQAGPYLDELAPELGIDLTIRAAPGAAPCDYLTPLRADLTSDAPDAVVFAFSGNSFISCMRDLSGNPLTGDAIVAKYRADVDAAVLAARTAHRPIVLASPPIAQGREAEWHALDAYYREVATTTARVRYLDAGARIAPGGRFALKQRCLQVETTLPEASPPCRSTRSRIAVRSADGLHFCGDPPNPAPLVCPGYASGARRYATNLLRGAKRALGRG